MDISLEYVLSCLLILTVNDNDMEHSLHVNGFSPKFIFRCSVILLNTENENSILAITSYLKRTLGLMHHSMFHPVENSTLAITTFNTFLQSLDFSPNN